MSIYALGFTASTANHFEVISGASYGFRLLEVAIGMGTGTTVTYNLYRPTAGGTATSPTALIAEDPNNTTGAQTTLATAWSAAPTIGSSTIIRTMLIASHGGIMWTFPKGLSCQSGGSGPTGSIFCHNSAAGTSNSWVVVEE